MDAVEVYLDGQKIVVNNPDEAMKYGIAMVHQELQPVPARTVAENLYLGRFPTKKYGPLQVIDHKKMYEDTIERLPDSKFFPYVCSEFERLWREVSTDYSDDKFVIQWK